MKIEQKASFILKTLNQLYPDPKPPLIYTNEFTLLISVLLSAQSTDKKVNEITPNLFKRADNAYKMSRLNTDSIYECIKQIGLAKTKSKNINLLSKLLVKNHNGKVPNTYNQLESLPGVGHKTASVVMAQAFNIPSFPVDTHIHRLSQRWGLSKGVSVEETELKLKKIFPIEKWNMLHLQIIFYGREYCSARGCYGRECFICKTLYPNRKNKFIHKKS